MIEVQGGVDCLAITTFNNRKTDLRNYVNNLGGSVISLVEDFCTAGAYSWLVSLSSFLSLYLSISSLLFPSLPIPLSLFRSLFSSLSLSFLALLFYF